MVLRWTFFTSYFGWDVTRVDNPYEDSLITILTQRERACCFWGRSEVVGRPMSDASASELVET